MDLTKLLTKSDVPWPEAIITRPDLRDAMLLQEDYASKESETTAILTYVYQVYIIDQMDETIADIIEHIAIAEMIHHEKLGIMIAQLGGTPAIYSKNGWWSGSYINYTKNIRDMLIHDIKAEQEAIANYKRTILRLNNDSIKEVIQRIILDEELHIETFKALLDYVTFWK